MRYVRSVQSVSQLVGNQKNCEAIKKNTLKRKNKKAARTEGSAFCFVVVISDEGANASTILHNSCYVAKRTRRAHNYLLCNIERSD